MSQKLSFQNGDREFAEPDDVINDTSLSGEQKVAVLENWRLDLLELQSATAENMPNETGDPGAVAERLRQVNDALSAARHSLEE